MLAASIAIFIITFVMPQIFGWARSLLNRLFRYRLEERVHFLFFEKRGSLDIAQWEDPKKNDLFSLVSENEYRILNSTERMFDLLDNSGMVIIAAAILAFYKWWTLPILIIATAPELWIAVKYGRRVWGIMNGRAETRRYYQTFANHFYEVSRITELKLFQNVAHFIGIIRELHEKFRIEEEGNERRRFRLGLGGLLTAVVGISVIVLAFIGDIVGGRLQVGTFIFIIGATMNFRSSISGLFQILGFQYGDNHFISAIFEFLDLPSVLPKTKRPEILIPAATPDIVFENVSFCYPGANSLSLENVSLTIPAGKKMALVGRNGAGKTTLVKLLCRFYDPTEGRILIGGQDLKEIEIDSWYSKLGILFQDFAHYRISIEKSIALGRSNISLSDERVHEAARMSDSDSFIRSLDDGYKQMLGRQFSGGIEPSIGQWQRLALARVFYRKSQVIILDEPTASIDAEGEAEIFERFQELSTEQSAILISHRFSTVRKASEIIVLDRGRIAESGSHDDLVANKSGIYSKLFRLQAKGYE